MKITKYVFNGVEYYPYDKVTLNFNVETTNIEKFLLDVAKLRSKSRINNSGCVFKVSEKYGCIKTYNHDYTNKYGTHIFNEVITIYGTSKSIQAKRIEITTTAGYMYQIMLRLGVPEGGQVLDNIFVSQHKLIKKN